MATIRAFLGDIEGSAGNVTFVKTGGVNILKQKVGSNSSNSPLQQAQRARFGGIGRFARGLAALLRVGYTRQGLQTGYSRFVGANIDAVTLDAQGAPLIDFGMIEVSAGSITPLVGLATAQLATGKTVTWADNSDGNNALASDKVYLALVKISTGETVLSLGSATRSGGTVAVPASYLIGLADSDMAVYAFAKRASGTEASNTTRIASGVGGGGTPAVTFSRSIAGPNNTVASTTLAASAGDLFEFDELATGTSAPYAMDINIAGVQVASVTTFDRYAGRPFRFTKNGVARTGVFAPVVNL